jgi:hypothetical protein
MDFEDTLTEIPDEMPNAIEKPKRKVTEKQLAALSAAREKRKTKTNALDKAKAIVAPPPPVLVRNPVPEFVEPAPKKKAAPKKKPAAPPPTVIQFQDSDDDSDGSDGSPPAPVIVIRRPPRRKTEPPAPAPAPVQVYEPRQYIRRAY